MSAESVSHSAIVLGTEVNGIAVIRSLGRLGIKCGAVTSTTRGDHAHQSRYLTCVKLIESRASDDDIIVAIIEVARQLGMFSAVLIPTTDRFSECLSRNRARLEPAFILCCPDVELCDTFLDKWKTARICELNDVLIPTTACPDSNEDLAEIANSTTYPVIVKPRYTFGTGFPGKNAVFNDRDGLLAFFSGSAQLGRCVVQQIIPSGDGDILVVATFSGNDHKVRAVYSGRKIRQLLPDYGATCFGLSERDPELESQSIRFLDSIRYRGFAALEFARSRLDGRKYFIELNTRTYYHNQLFSDAGIDLTQVAYLESTGQDVTATLGLLRQKEGLFWLDFRRDFQSMRIKRQQGRISVLGWLGSILRSRSFAYWDWRDPLPFVAGCIWRAKDMSVNAFRRVVRANSNARPRP